MMRPNARRSPCLVGTSDERETSAAVGEALDAGRRDRQGRQGSGTCVPASTTVPMMTPVAAGAATGTARATAGSLRPDAAERAYRTVARERAVGLRPIRCRSEIAITRTTYFGEMLRSLAPCFAPVVRAGLSLTGVDAESTRGVIAQVVWATYSWPNVAASTLSSYVTIRVYSTVANITIATGRKPAARRRPPRTRPDQEIPGRTAGISHPGEDPVRHEALHVAAIGVGSPCLPPRLPPDEPTHR